MKKVFKHKNHQKTLNIKKEVENSQKSISTSFRVPTAPERWSKYTTLMCLPYV